jgi:hypothetical protein
VNAVRQLVERRCEEPDVDVRVDHRFARTVFVLQTSVAVPEDGIEVGAQVFVDVIEEVVSLVAVVANLGRLGCCQIQRVGLVGHTPANGASAWPCGRHERAVSAGDSISRTPLTPLARDVLLDRQPSAVPFV